MKKVFVAEGVTEYPPGPELERLRAAFQRNAAVYLCIDVSGSMQDDLGDAVRGARSFLEEAIGGGYHVGVVLWSYSVEGITELSRSSVDAEALLCRARAGGGTQLTPALEAASEELLRFDAVDRVIAVFGDGMLGDQREAEAMARSLTSRGIRILTLGLGEEAASSLASLDSEGGVPRMTQSASLSRDIQGLGAGLRRGRRK